ncbi:MAG: choice-of-anchor D domain-containing protein, partial [Pseudomonadota bacterium]
MLCRKFPVFASVVLVPALLFFAAPAEAQYNAFKDPSVSRASAEAAGGLDFKAVTEEIKGGKVSVGGTAYIVVLFKNQGASSVKVGTINLYPSSTVSAQATLNQCADAPLSTDAQCAVTVAVKGLQSGAWRVDVLVDHSGRSRIAMASISGDVEPLALRKDEAVKGDVEASPASMDFGTSPGGIALVRAVVLNNRSADVVKIKDFILNAPEQSGYSYKSQCPETLQPGETCNIIVTWLPTSKGLAQGVLAVRHSGKSGMAQVELKGVLQPVVAGNAAKNVAGKIELSPESMDFGTSPGGIALKRSVVLSNHTDEDVDLWDIDMKVPEQSGFSYESQCPEMLQPEETCNIIVTWLPTSKGLAQGVMMVRHSGKSGMAQVELKGVLQSTGDAKKDAAGRVEAFPASMDFGTSSGGIPLVRSMVLSNNSAEGIKINNIILNAPEQSGFSYKSQCPETIWAGESCNVIVTWLPTSKGLAQGVLVVQHSGKNGMVQTELKGQLQLTGDTAKDAGGKVEISPVSMDFGTSPGGIAVKRSVLLSNHTIESVDLWDIDMKVPEQSGFSYGSQCPETLQPEETCNIIVTWLPTSKGLAQGVMMVRHSGKSGMAQVELKGVLQPPESSA